MTDFVFWPRCLLRPAKPAVLKTPFSRGGGRTIGGLDRSTTTDRGYWSISFGDVLLRTPAQKRTWEAIGTALGGKPGLLVVPVYGSSTSPYASGHFEEAPLTAHDDGSTFDDGSEYYQGAIDVQMATFAPLGATVVTLRVINGAPNVAGVKFSYQHALYETGPIRSESGDAYTVPVFPALRQAIPADAWLEFDQPDCLVHLNADNGMDAPPGGVEKMPKASVSFVEAADYWNDLARGLV